MTYIALPEEIAGWPDFKTAPVSGGGIGVAWRDAAGVRSAIVHEHDGALVLAAPICRDVGVDPRRALLLATRLHAGAIVLVADTYLVRCVVAPERRDGATVVRALRWIVAEARTLRRFLGGPARAHALNMFTLYAE
jgi:hypothetical protein